MLRRFATVAAAAPVAAASGGAKAAGRAAAARPVTRIVKLEGAAATPETVAKELARRKAAGLQLPKKPTMVQHAVVSSGGDPERVTAALKVGVTSGMIHTPELARAAVRSLLRGPGGVAAVVEAIKTPQLRLHAPARSFGEAFLAAARTGGKPDTDALRTLHDLSRQRGVRPTRSYSYAGVKSALEAGDARLAARILEESWEASGSSGSRKSAAAAPAASDRTPAWTASRRAAFVLLNHIVKGGAAAAEALGPRLTRWLVKEVLPRASDRTQASAGLVAVAGQARPLLEAAAASKASEAAGKEGEAPAATA